MKFQKLGVMLDCSRNAVMKPEKVMEYMDMIAEMGYNCLMLYTEDTYEIENRPYFGHNRGKYSLEELRQMDAHANKCGIELIPCIQTLAHLRSIFRWPVFQKVNDCNDVLLADEDETYALIEDMFKSLKSCFTSKTVNIGMDEAFSLGRGKYLDKHKSFDRMDILLRHLNKVSEIAEKYGYELLMWGDMFFRLLNTESDSYYKSISSVPEKVKELVPKNVTLIYWDYYSTDQTHYENQILSHRQIKEHIWFAGGAWTWCGFAPHNDFAIKATTAAFKACIGHGISNIFLTAWGDNGGECSRFSVLPALYYASELAKGNYDEDKIKQSFQEKYQISFDDFMLLDLPGTSNENTKLVGTEKTFLYNDCFLGLFDSIVKEEYGLQFQKISEKLQPLTNDPKYGILFETLEKLTKVLALKCDIGLSTRNAYKSGDKKLLETVLSRYDETLEALEDFYKCFERQWMWENKSHGFDVQDLRLGGLQQRIRHCKMILERYVHGEEQRIEELEEPLLDAYCREGDDAGSICGGMWENVVTTNKIYGI